MADNLRFRADEPADHPGITVDAFLDQPDADAVRVEPGDDARALIPHLARLRLIEVNFPVFGDGRGYSSARILREAGYRKEEGDSWFGILAPTGTSPAVIAKLEKAIGDAVRSPDIAEKLHLGGCYVTYLNATDFRSRISDESIMFGNIIQKGNIKLT